MPTDAPSDASTEDLQNAIQTLIYRLRELGPITQSQVCNF
jgi:hypothetical protein